MFTLYKKIITQVSNDCNICIMRQEKGGLIVIDILKYRGKYLELLQTNQFLKLNHDPIKHLKIKSRKKIKKLKSKIISTAILSVVSNRLIPRKILWECKIT